MGNEYVENVHLLVIVEDVSLAGTRGGMHGSRYGRLTASLFCRHGSARCGRATLATNFKNRF